MKTIDITGLRFGKLVATKRIGRKGHNTVWECRCDCGNTTKALMSNLKKGATKSCGCIVKTIGGDCKSPLYYTWRSMIKRCHSDGDISYKNYGGRGIKVCPEWRYNYLVFKDWAVCSGYRRGLSIDRIDNDGGYGPNNCRWATDLVQCNNKRNNINLVFNDETKTIAEWARHFKVNHERIRMYVVKHGVESFQWYAEHDCRIRNNAEYGRREQVLTQQDIFAPNVSHNRSE